MDEVPFDVNEEAPVYDLLERSRDELTKAYQSGASAAAGKEAYDIEKILAEYAGDDRVVTSPEFIEIEASRPAAEHVFKTGIKSLDELTENVETGELTVISGPSGHGKTLLADTITRYMALNGQKCLWFTFEVLPKKFLDKYRKPGSPVIFLPLERKPGSVRWLEERIHEAKLKYDCRAIFIDHLHFIVDMARMKNPSLEIGTVLRYLKTEVAIKHNVAVFLIAHLTKTKYEQEPDESDIRDSSFIVQESDNVWMVTRRLDEGKTLKDNNPFSNRAKILICKARRSGVLRRGISLCKIGDDLREEDRLLVPGEQNADDEADLF
jgi:replicative DNA helicase